MARNIAYTIVIEMATDLPDNADVLTDNEVIEAMLANPNTVRDVITYGEITDVQAEIFDDSTKTDIDNAH